MNTFIVDEDIYISAKLLDPHRLFSSIYEGIHGLASNMGISEQLVNPKKNKSSHPCAMQYVDHDYFWFVVLWTYYIYWANHYAKKETNIVDTVNYHNLEIIYHQLIEEGIYTDLATVGTVFTSLPYDWQERYVPSFIKKMIKIHQAVLYVKDPDFYGKYDNWCRRDNLLDEEIPMMYYDPKEKYFKVPKSRN